jgi:hypothetical protein
VKVVDRVLLDGKNLVCSEHPAAFRSRFGFSEHLLQATKNELAMHVSHGTHAEVG